MSPLKAQCDDYAQPRCLDARPWAAGLWGVVAVVPQGYRVERAKSAQPPLMAQQGLGVESTSTPIDERPTRPNGPPSTISPIRAWGGEVDPLAPGRPDRVPC